MNIKIVPDGFKNFNGPIMSDTIEMVASLLENCSGVKSQRYIIVRHHTSSPTCINEGKKRAIYLNIEDCYIDQMIYQFAHEYLHNLIDRRPMLKCSAGLTWFEEILCEVASRFSLWYFSNLNKPSQEVLCKTTPMVQRHRDTLCPLILLYLQDGLRPDPDMSRELEEAGSLIPWLPILYGRSDDYDRYSVIANEMLPLFCTNPHLWQIIAHIGHSAHWQSLGELFAHLESETSADCHESLHELYRILLGSYS